MSAPEASACPICGAAESSAVYAGPVRDGRFGTLTRPIEVLECPGCGTRRLSECLEECSEYYESERYRQEVDGDAGVASFKEAHDAEQAARLAIIGTGRLRGAVIADIGCGAGSFLDAVAGVADRCVAIEPADHFRTHLEERGYSTYAYAGDAVSSRESVDLATCFSVIEHVEDPVGFLRDIAGMLKPEGRLVVSTPNAADALLTLLPGDYECFFYRKAHLYYFTAEAITTALQMAGFTDVTVRYVQRFGLGNTLAWLRERQPMGDHREASVTDAIDAVWRAELERTGTADYIYVEATKAPRS